MMKVLMVMMRRLRGHAEIVRVLVTITSKLRASCIEQGIIHENYATDMCSFQYPNRDIA